MPAIKNLILDWSGTLVDDFPPVLTATNRLFERRGKPAWTAEEFREKFFLPFPEFYRIHLPDATHDQLEADYHEAFRHMQDEIPLLPFAKDFLDYARRRGMPMFLLSTIHPEHFKVQSARLGIGDYFTKAYTGALDKRKTIGLLLAEHGLDPAETLFVGDMAHDIETARHGGVMSCAVLTGYDSLEKLKQVSPDLLYQNLHQVRGWLEEHRVAVETPPPIGTVGALIYNAKGEVLMIQTYKWSNLWGIPGGKIKGNEPSLDALRREVREETALELGEIRFAMVQDCIGSTEFYKKAHFLLLNYTARVSGGDAVTLNEEADRFRWVPPGEASGMSLNRPTRILLDHVRSHPHLAFDA